MAVSVDITDAIWLMQASAPFDGEPRHRNLAKDWVVVKQLSINFDRKGICCKQ